jgi:hypothetical protein
MTDNLEQKNPKNFNCNYCYYNTFNKKDYNRHLLTSKHAKMVKILTFTDKNGKDSPLLENQYTCKCGKLYKHRQSLFTHKKICKIDNTVGNNYGDQDENNIVKNSDPSDKELIMLLIKENSDFKNMMMKVLENGTHNTTHTNSHNKSFNLQFFLNETCKDAMNITDFVDSLKLQLSDLERVGELGYIEGISSIIVRNLKELDVTQRPVHCMDKKRETIYIKDKDKWEKDEDKIKMHKLVKKVADKNARLLPKFKEKYPDYNKASSRTSDQYNKIIIESMGGHGDNDFEKEEKIIKKVSKEVVVDKE